MEDKRVKCIDKNRGQEITIGKEYKVLSESEKLYFIENDLDEPIGYFKEKFEVVEDKIIRVRCINDGGIGHLLTVNKEYPVLEENEDWYYIKADNGRKDGFQKHLFEEVKEDILMVECIDTDRSLLNLTLGKRYKLERSNEDYYYVVNDYGLTRGYDKSVFKPVPKEKEIKEYTVMELFEEEEGIKYKDEEGYTFYVQNNVLFKSYDDGEAVECLMNKRWFDIKFTKVEEPKPASTVEAFKALEEGKIIESLETKNRYRKRNGELYIKGMNKDKFGQTGSIYFIEIEEQWLIIE